MVGSALGDALGELAFRYQREPDLRLAIERADVLTYTDDTAMAIGLAESIIQMGELDAQHLGNIFREHFLREPWRGYASGPPTIFSLVERRGMTYSEAARSLFGGQGSFGNGAAMRIAPLGLFFHRSPDLYEQACLSASVTHAHPVGMDGAAVQACAIAQAVTLNPEEPFPFDVFCRRLAQLARTPELRGKMEMVKALITQGISPSQAAGHLGRGVAVQESLPFAIYAFLRHPHYFGSCLFCAVLHGGDRDTLGAMACAILGAYLGVEAIPQEWQNKLENHQYIEGLAMRLAEMSN